jgi:hypothetical protein
VNGVSTVVWQHFISELLNVPLARASPSRQQSQWPGGSRRNAPAPGCDAGTRTGPPGLSSAIKVPGQGGAVFRLGALGFRMTVPDAGRHPSRTAASVAGPRTVPFRRAAENDAN